MKKSSMRINLIPIRKNSVLGGMEGVEYLTYWNELLGFYSSGKE